MVIFYSVHVGQTSLTPGDEAHARSSWSAGTHLNQLTQRPNHDGGNTQRTGTVGMDGSPTRHYANLNKIYVHKSGIQRDRSQIAPLPGVTLTTGLVYAKGMFFPAMVTLCSEGGHTTPAIG